jgi:hypothetical protein
MPVVPALRRVRKEKWEFKASLGNTVIPCLKNYNKPHKTPNKQNDNNKQIKNPKWI